MLLLSLAKKVFSYLHIRQKTEAGKPKICSASDAQIVKNLRRSAALWVFLGGLCSAMCIWATFALHCRVLGAVTMNSCCTPWLGAEGGNQRGTFLRFKLTTDLAPWVLWLHPTLACLSPPQIRAASKHSNFHRVDLRYLVFAALQSFLYQMNPQNPISSILKIGSGNPFSESLWWNIQDERYELIANATHGYPQPFHFAEKVLGRSSGICYHPLPIMFPQAFHRSTNWPPKNHL